MIWSGEVAKPLCEHSPRPAIYADCRHVVERHAVHHPSLDIVVNAIMLGAAIIPHRGIARCPPPSDGVLRLGDMTLEEREDRIGVARPHPREIVEEMAEQ